MVTKQELCKFYICFIISDVNVQDFQSIIQYHVLRIQEKLMKGHVDFQM